MAPTTEIQSIHRKTFDFILFHLGPFLLGTETSQVVRIKTGNMPQIASNVEQVNLRDIFNLPSNEIPGFSPTVLEISGESGRTDVSVDAAKGIISLNLNQIKRLPPLVDFHKSHSSLWGLALLDEKIVFLLDLDQLKTKKNDNR